ncbi:MAG: hypothetical protein ABSB22_01340 [Thermodesulfobacteriota bacterium]|jgi:hypothetical protein
MSFYLGLILKELVGIVSDRTILDPATGGKDVSRPRFSKVNEHTFFIPAGLMKFAEPAYNCLREIFGDLPLDLRKTCDYETAFSEKVGSQYREIKSRAIGYLGERGIDIQYARFDSLLAGISSAGVLYIINLSDTKQFSFEAFTRPFTSLTIGAESEKARKGLNGSMSQFMAAVAKEPLIRQRALVKKFLLAVVDFVSKYSDVVSVEGDLILIEKGGSEIYTF